MRIDMIEKKQLLKQLLISKIIMLTVGLLTHPHTPILIP